MSNIPNIYQELEYIENTGTLWINTGVTTPTSSTIITKWEGLIGYNTDNNQDINFIAGYDNSNYGHYCEIKDQKFGFNGGYVNVALVKNQLYKASMTINGNESITYNITTNTINTNSFTEQLSSTMGTFALFAINSTSIAKHSKIGANKLYINNTIVRDFTPVKRISDGEIGMYDSITNTFYINSGSGVFLAGYKKIPGLKLKLKDNSNLHLGDLSYILLEYIRREGEIDPYIDTGVKILDGITVEFLFRILNKPSREVVFFGSTSLDYSGLPNRHSAGRFYMLFADNYGRVYIGNKSSSISIGNIVYQYKYNEINTLNYNTSRIIHKELETTYEIDGDYLDESLVTTLKFGYPCIALPNSYCDMDLFYVKIWNEDDELIQHLIPCMDKDRNVGMIDLVTLNFFPNRGGGNFIAGPQVKYTFSEISDDALINCTLLYIENCPEVANWNLLNAIHYILSQNLDTIKYNIYTNTSLWNNIMQTYPNLSTYTSENYKIANAIYESNNPLSIAESCLNIFENYPEIMNIIEEHPKVIKFIVEDPDIIHNLIETDYYRWMDSDGNCYINTNYCPHSETKIECILKSNTYISGISDKFASMTRLSRVEFQFDIMYRDNTFFGGNRTKYDSINNIPISDNTIYEIRNFINNSSTVNGVTYTYALGTTSRFDGLPLFGVYSKHDTTYTANKGYKMNFVDIYDSNVLTHRFIPFNGTYRLGILDIVNLDNIIFIPKIGSGEFTYLLEAK